MESLDDVDDPKVRKRRIESVFDEMGAERYKAKAARLTYWDEAADASRRVYNNADLAVMRYPADVVDLLLARMPGGNGDVSVPLFPETMDEKSRAMYDFAARVYRNKRTWVTVVAKDQFYKLYTMETVHTAVLDSQFWLQMKEMGVNYRDARVYVAARPSRDQEAYFAYSGDTRRNVRMEPNKPTQRTYVVLPSLKRARAAYNAWMDWAPQMRRAIWVDGETEQVSTPEDPWTWFGDRKA